MDKKDNQFIVNEKLTFLKDNLEQGTIERTSSDTFRFYYKNVNYEVKLYEREDKNYLLKIDGYTFKVLAKDDLDLLIEKLGFNEMSAQALSSIKAPMPGLVLDIMVGPGDEIKKGDSLLILEAMKMENVLKAEGDGVVKSIEISVGDKVDKGQILIEI